MSDSLPQLPPPSDPTVVDDLYLLQPAHAVVFRPVDEAQRAAAARLEQLGVISRDNMTGWYIWIDPRR